MDSIANFRDLGGIRTAEGCIKKKQLLRSGELVEISKPDRAKLIDEFELRLIIDFRDESEISKRPDVIMECIEYCNIDIMENIEETTTNLEKITKDFNMIIAEEGMKDIYTKITLDKYARLGYNRFIHKLVEHEKGAALFHCFAGKDRTGIGAAILLTILGVNKNDIFEDYLLTNAMRKTFNVKLIQEARRDGLSEQQLAGLETLYTVKESFLHSMYTAIYDKYGTFENYIKNGLMVSPSIIEKLRRKYVE